MPSEGPSKEQLEYYYKNSRKYFDELAKYYYDTDRAYYDKFIAPYYSLFGSALSGSSQSSSSSGKPMLAVVIAVMIAILGVGLAAFFIMQGTRDADYENKKSTEDIDKNTRKESAPAADTTSAKRKQLSDFSKGIEYYNQKDYENAERYFKRVSEDDENYDDAQNKIDEIKSLKKDVDDGNNRDRYVKPKPVERIR